MNSIALLPKTGVDHQENLKNLILHCQRYSPFSVGWYGFKWNVTGKCKSSSDSAHTETFLYFSRDNGKDNKVKVSSSEMRGFYNDDLADIAKCHICRSYTTSAGELKKGTLQNMINTYRFLDVELRSSRSGVNGLTKRTFIKALQAAINKLAFSTAYREGVRLTQISDFIDKHRLTPSKIKFKSPLNRKDAQTASDTKIDEKNTINRNKKMPDSEVLKAVGMLSAANLEGDLGLFMSIVEMQFATGFRTGEIFTLSTDCLYQKAEEEYNDLTGEYDAVTFWEIKYFAEKKGYWHTKVLPDVMVPIFKKGFDFILEYLQPVRDILSEIESNGSYDFFPELSGICFPNEEGVYKYLGSSNSNANTKLKSLDVTIENRERENQESLGKRKAKKANSFNASELKDIVSDRAVESTKKLWGELKNRTTATKLSEMLLITQHQRHHSKKSTTHWEFCTITDSQYRDFLTGRDTMDDVNSIFQRKDMVIDGVNFRITSHQFRHFLNTLCQLSGEISELEIARYFGRAHIADNQAYDHTNKAKMIMDRAEDILASNNITKEQAVDAMTIFNLVDSEEALDAIRNMTTSHVSSIGLCEHDFNDSPCGKHYACLRGCANYKRIKGEPSEIDELTRIKEQQELHIEEAKETVAEEYRGANNWLLSHQELLDGCNEALAVEDDDSISEGVIVQIFPEGKDKCEAIQ